MRLDPRSISCLVITQFLLDVAPGSKREPDLELGSLDRHATQLNTVSSENQKEAPQAKRLVLAAQFLGPYSTRCGSFPGCLTAR